MGATKVQFETEILELILETFPNQTFAAVEKNGKMGCQSPSTALANRKYWVAALAAAFFKLPNLVCTRSESPQSALRADRHERPLAAVYRRSERCAVAFALLPFVHGAALLVSEGRARRSEPMSQMRDQSSGRDVILNGENPLNGLK